MLVTFRVKDKTTRLHSEPAEISALELASLMRRLHAGHADIETESHEFSAAPLNFEVNANSLSLARPGNPAARTRRQSEAQSGGRRADQTGLRRRVTHRPLGAATRTRWAQYSSSILPVAV